MTFSRDQLHALAESADPATAAAIRRRLSPTPAAAAGGVAAFHRIDRSAAGPYRSTAERLYAAWLDAQRAAGVVVGWGYECDRVKLPDPVDGEDGREGGRSRWYVNDFTVCHADGRLSFDQVKGGWATRQGMDRFRWLCAAYPWRWCRLWVYEGGTWRLKLESGRPHSRDT